MKSHSIVIRNPLHPRRVLAVLGMERSGPCPALHPHPSGVLRQYLRRVKTGGAFASKTIP